MTTRDKVKSKLLDEVRNFQNSVKWKNHSNQEELHSLLKSFRMMYLVSNDKDLEKIIETVESIGACFDNYYIAEKFALLSKQVKSFLDKQVDSDKKSK